MLRNVSWKRIRSDEVSALIDEAQQATMYLVNQKGPTGFLLKQENSDKKIKVLLGDPHSCTCSSHHRDKSLCVHILWILLKKFRVPKENPIVHQLGLVEREINEVIHSQWSKPDSPKEEEFNKTGSCGQRPVSPNDICPICQDEMQDKRRRLTFCRYGCGNSVHLRCLKMLADHQSSQGGETIQCPLCRGTFCTFIEFTKELHSCARNKVKTGREAVHSGVTCDNCQCSPISGRCFKCVVCPSVHLCHSCFKHDHHSQHEFKTRQHPSHNWRPVMRAVAPPQLPTLEVNSIQHHEITDHNLLLQLDHPCPPSSLMVDQRTPTRAPQSLLSALPTEPLDHSHTLIITGAKCFACSQKFKRGEWIRKLPCGHKFHNRCIDRCLSYDGPTCPIDGKPLNPRTRKCGSFQRGSLKSATLHHSSSANQRMAPLDMIISGHTLPRIGNSNVEDDQTIHQGLQITSQRHPVRKIVHGSHHKQLQKREIDLSLQATGLLADHTSMNTTSGTQTLQLPQIIVDQRNSSMQAPLRHHSMTVNAQSISKQLTRGTGNKQRLRSTRRRSLQTLHHLPSMRQETSLQPTLSVAGVVLSEHTLPDVDTHQ